MTDHLSDANLDLTKPQQGILDAIAWLNDKGIAHPTREMVSAICKKRGGAYNNNVSSLKTRGYLHYPVEGHLELTEAGADFANHQPDDGRSLFEHWKDVLSNPQRDILDALVEDGQALTLTREQLSERVGKSGGAFNNNVSAMCTMGALYYPQKGSVSVTKNVVQ